MRIAVLGWGSLVWDPAALRIVAPFVPKGPMLPIEFSRISRHKRLTLVIDERNGRRCRSYVAQSALATLDDALRDLWLREARPAKPPPEPIRENTTVTWIDIDRGELAARARERPRVCKAIADWAREAEWDAVVWTALGPKFRDAGQGDYSVDAAIKYLAGLTGTAADEAFQYIRKAPTEVQTPVREAFDRRWPQLAGAG
ncbi:MAG: hypothetical protein JOY64_10295 [Alphaproteobacteria bacterium]|nr:hypothetical protein [Alphaproteobacteria bacterium]MBV8408008.1 hypothetical protein [Alphaproteobacteria bacterium]